MSLACAYEGDSEGYVRVSELVTSDSHLKCVECKTEILAGIQHYFAEEYEFEGDDEIIRRRKPCCEECGDLAMSFLDLGYCWAYGDLRSDISEMNEEYGRKPARRIAQSAEDGGS